MRERNQALTATQRVAAVGARALLDLSSRRGQLAILTYHRVLDAADPLQPLQFDRRSFESQMEVLSRIAVPLPLLEAVGRLRDGKLPPRAVCVTFDDGYADTLTNALPILRRHGVPATLFVTEGLLDGGLQWSDAVIEAVRALPEGDYAFPWLREPQRAVGPTATRAGLVRELLLALKYLAPEDRRRATDALAHTAGAVLPRSLMLRRADLSRLRDGGFEIGAHTLSHPILARLDDAAAWREIADSRQRLQELLGSPVTSFAYPNGRPAKDYDRRHLDMVRRAGYTCAVSTAWGVARRGSDVYQLPRMGLWPCTPIALMKRLVAAQFAPPAAAA